MDKLCMRSVEFTPVNDGEGDGRTLEGYGAVFNTPTEINSPYEGKFREQIAPGAFANSLGAKKPIMQFDHGRDVRTGSVPIAAIQECREDAHGLYVKARMFDNPVVEPIRQAIAEGAISGMSFAFRVDRDEWRDGSGRSVHPDELARLLHEPGSRGPLQRTITQVRLHEVGPVVKPAYAATSVGVRSVEEEDVTALVAQYRETYEPDEVRDAGPEDVPGPPCPPVPSPLPGDKGYVPEPYDPVANARAALDYIEKTYGDRGGDAPGDGSKPYGDVTYADPGYQADKKKRYPIDTAEHVKAALAYINKGTDASKYSSGDLAKVKAKIHAAAGKFGISVSESKSSDDVDTVRQSEQHDNANPLAESGHTNAQNRKAVPMPKSIDELRARLDEISGRMAELGEDETRSLDDAEQEEWDGLVEESRQAEEAIEKIEARAEALKKVAQRYGGRVEGGSDRGTPAFHQERDVWDMETVRRDASDHDDMVRRYDDNALRALEKVNFGDTEFGNQEDAQAAVEKLIRNKPIDDHNGVVARRVLATGTAAYERAFGKIMCAGSVVGADLSPEEYRALEHARREIARSQTVSPDSAGGYAIPFQLDPSVMLDNNSTINPVRELARKVQIVGKQWNGVVSAGVTVTRGTEGAVAPDSSFTLSQPTVTTNRVQAFIPFSMEVDLEWGALRTEITTMLMDGKEREEDSFVTGNGTSPNPGGVVGTATGIFTTATTATLAAADIYQHELNLAPRWRKKGQWLANKAFYHKIRQFDTAGGAQLWQRIGGGLPPELLSYPTNEASAMSTAVSTTGANVAVFADFQQFLIVDRIGMQVELIPHFFDPTTARPQGMRGVYAIWMNNSKILVQDGIAVLQIK